MSLQVVLGNPEKSKLGTVTIQLPIPRGQYTKCIEKLEALGIGDAVEADCEVGRIDGTFPNLGMLQISNVNICGGETKLGTLRMEGRLHHLPLCTDQYRSYGEPTQ